MKRIYQWLTGQASFFGFGAVERGPGRTVRTKVTVRRERMTLLVDGAATVGYDTCPLCGSKLAPGQASVLHTQTIVAKSEVGSKSHLTIGAKVTEK